MRGVTGPRAEQRCVFGFHPSAGDARAAATLMLAATDRPRLAVTPNLDHVARLRRSPAFRRAYRNADLILCDGAPVHAYARIFAPEARHVTGCDLLAALLASLPGSIEHRAFFVIDGEETASALAGWAERRGMAARVGFAVPPHGFASDPLLRADLAARIARHRTTLLLMCVGAPQSEIFVDRARAVLPPCWAACVGQALKVELGLVTRAPRALRAVGLEWAWRLAQEPRRLARRYALGAADFAIAIAEDLLDRGNGLLAEDV